MKILVTGGAGFIGSHIVDQYITAGHEVAIVDNLWEEGGGKETNINPQARFFYTDITDEAAMERVFNEIRPENVLGLLNVLANCTRVGTRKIIFASSGASYGTSDLQPVDEQTPQRPESPYGITKMVAEHYLRYWHEENGLNYTALRYGNVYGPRQDPNGEAGVIAIFARRMLAHEPVRIDWDGEQKKDYVYVGDVAHASLLALDHGDNDIFCIGTGKGTSVNELYRAMTQIISYQVEIVRASKRPGDIYLSYFNCSKAERCLGWKPQVTLEEGMRDTVQFFRMDYKS